MSSIPVVGHSTKNSFYYKRLSRGFPRSTSSRALVGLMVACALTFTSPAAGTGGSPTDPFVFDISADPLPLTLSAGEEIWLRLDFVPASDASHVAVETTGSTDTLLAAFASLSEAQADSPLMDDDDSGTGLNAALTIPLGFPSPLLLRIAGYSSSTAGPLQVQGELTFVPGERCDWPAGCPLATAGRGEPNAREMLTTLRRVRSEILTRTATGRELIDLYWRLGRDLTPNLLLDGEFRRTLYQQIKALLPLADDALAANRGNDAGMIFSRTHFEQLRQLVELVSSRLDSDLAAELENAWSAFALSDQIKRPLRDVLADVALLSPQSQPTTVIFKLRVEPKLERKSATGLLLVGDHEVDVLLADAEVRTLRRVHRNTPAHRQAGLTRTIAIEVQGIAAAERLVAALSVSPAVQWAEVSAEARVFAPPPGEDPYRAELWGLDAIQAPDAWSTETGSCSTLVAIIDTGFRTGIADLAGRLREDLGRDFAEDDLDPFDRHGHGTHVGSTVAAAADNSTSIAGVAPDVCIFAVKVLTDDGSGSFEDVAEGVVYAADAGASVMNLSLGCDCEPQQVLEDALEYAAARNVVIVAASGNDSLDQLGYPASSPTTIAVGAVDESLDLASFSNYGPGQDLVAPGVDVVSLFPDGESCEGSGTSMAAPHVAGVVALMRSQEPNLPREEVRQRLRAGARDLGVPGPDERFGAGLVNASSAVGGGGSPATCSSEDCMLLQQQRFEVRVGWRDFMGQTGSGTVVPYGSDDSGLLWFFDASNWEMLVKVLDGCGINQHFWVFAAATTDVQYTLYVTDTVTGTTKTYFNPLGVASAAITDTTAFASCAASGAAVDSPPLAGGGPARVDAPVVTSLPKTSCGGGGDHLCLNRGRFRADVSWRDFDGNSGVGHAVPYGSDDSGMLWFFHDSNWEMLIKVLEGCPINDHFWVFAAATTDVEYTLRITDTQNGRVVDYHNSLGRAAPAITDTSAFSCSP